MGVHDVNVSFLLVVMVLLLRRHGNLMFPTCTAGGGLIFYPTPRHLSGLLPKIGQRTSTDADSFLSQSCPS